MQNKPVYTIIITGNHHTPAIELIRQLSADPISRWKIYYFSQLPSTDTHLKKTIIPLIGDKFIEVNTGKFDRTDFFRTFFGLFFTFLAIFRTLVHLSRIHPKITVSFGGYSSVPTIISSYLLRIPSITHEQTLTISLATRINSIFCTKVALSFPPSPGHSLPLAKIHLTGNLLRRQLFNAQSTTYRQLNSAIHSKPLIYITGGSQGSESINLSVKTILKTLAQKYTIIHHTGIKDFPFFHRLSSQYHSYYPTEYVKLSDIGWVFRHAQLIISRSGANICQEIVALDKTSLLIPLPFSQQNEQLLNANWVKQNIPDRTIIIEQKNLTPKVLSDNIRLLAKYPASLPKTYIENYRLLNLIHENIQS